MKKGLFITGLLLSLLMVPNAVKAAEMSEEFKAILNKDGYLEVNSVPPTKEEQAGLLLGDYVLSVRTEGRFGVYIDSCNSDFTICDIEKYDGERHPVKIKYVYNENIKKQVDKYVENLGTKNIFSVRDMEVVNFWINAKGDEGLVKDYSSELKEYFDFKNFEFDIRLGNPGEFIRLTGGEGNIVFDGTIYHYGGYTEVQARHVLYVSESTGNSKEELMDEIQKRIDDYIGKDVVEIAYGGNVYDYFITNYDKDIDDIQRELDLENAKSDRDELKILELGNQLSLANDYKNYFLDSWNNRDGEYGFLRDAEGGHFFYATIPGNEGSENVFKFIVIKDDNKLYVPSHKTTDVNTEVTISSNNSTIPLDTMIKAMELTSGEEYEKIIKILNLANSLTFDLKLYSKSLENYVTKLADGTFEVKIPLPENYKGKDLIVYYVTNDGKTEEYTVTEKNGYAIFNTNHFSIYTLAIKNDRVEDNKTPVANPDTSDNIVVYFGLSIISGLGILLTSRKFKREI